MNIQTTTLSTVAALGADCSIVNRSIVVTGLQQAIPVRGLRPTSVIAPVTEVLQVTTGTPTAANSTLYTIVLTYTNKVTRIIEAKEFNFLSDASATATEICDGFRRQINALNAIIPVVASGTTTLVLTAQAGFSDFQVLSNGVGVIAFATGTAGVTRVGYGEDIKASFPDAAVVNTSYYTQVIMDYEASGDSTQTMRSPNVVNRAAVFVLSGATNAATLVGTYGTLTQAITGVQATHVAGAGTVAATAATSLLTLTGGTFVAQNVRDGDVIYQIITTPYLINNVLTTTTANAIVGSDAAGAAYTIVRLRNI